MATLTTETGDYWNVSVAIHALPSDCKTTVLNNFLMMRLLPIHYAHRQRAPSASFDASLFTQIKERRPRNIHALGANKLLHRLNECIARLVILMNSSVASPFPCLQYPTQSKALTIYWTDALCDIKINDSCFWGFAWKSKTNKYNLAKRLLMFYIVFFLLLFFLFVALSPLCQLTGTLIVKWFITDYKESMS